MKLETAHTEIRGDQSLQGSADNVAASGAACSVAGSMPALAPVILAGGAGTRLWPLSREQYPKQLLDLVGPDTLLRATARRTQGLAAVHTTLPPIVVCGEEHRFVTMEQLSGCGVEARYIVEPVRRNTAPALTLAAVLLMGEGNDVIIVSLPADHAITDIGEFERSIGIAAQHAQHGAIVALGVPPTRADTGYGYIQIGEPLGDTGRSIECFVEKPHADLATRFVDAGTHWWNSGIFVVRASVWLETVATLQRQMYEACMAAYDSGIRDGMCFYPHAGHFGRVPSDSIDYAVMEKLRANAVPASGVVVPLEAGWTDLGSWGAVWDVLDKDADGNVARGRVVFERTASTLAHAQGRLIACVGVKDIVVVETDDAVLVADRAHVDEVKALVSRMKIQAAPEADTHRKVQRPWGFYDAVDSGERFQVKRLVVRPGGRLSLQLHHHRAEHWVVVRGTALVTRGDEEFFVGENESTYIPVGVKHRIGNPGKIPLEIIEVQSGAYLGEDDIVRFEDSYGRT